MKENFYKKIKSGDLLVSDGATGTNLQARGLENGIPSEEWLFINPDEIVKLHRDFIDAGADIILTNTFGGSAVRLKSSNDDRVEEVNKTAVELAKKAAEGSNVYIAGSMGPSGGLIKPYGSLDIEEVFESFRRQAKALTEAGVDLIVVETQFDLGEAGAAIKAVRAVSDLPLVCSFSYDRGTKTMMGVTAEQMVDHLSSKEFRDLEILMFGVNCGKSLEDNLAVLVDLRKATQLPLWFKPNAGLPEVNRDGTTFYKVTPDEMATNVKKWREVGAQVIGGCCGTTPEHLRAIAKAVKN